MAFILINLVLIGSLLVYQPRWLLLLLTKIAPGVVYYADLEEPIIALTIDDGIDSIFTPQILELLDRYQARATFFLISSTIPGNESIVRSIVSSGHEIGNHLTKDEPSIKLSSTEFESSLVEAERILAQFSPLKWLRPGGGWYNSTMIDIANQYNYRVALGSIFPYDTHIPFSWFASWQILTNVHPGAIIVLHDGGERGEKTLSTLQTILPQLKRKGYRFVTLTELFELAQQ
ncbi:MAG: chitin deacetylase family protein [Xenococcaceae cyanobacterium MO_188.B29]|nr:chitin deacetylase family protein [Xenococcaceae cyanobacterium MO_188.B29]